MRISTVLTARLACTTLVAILATGWVGSPVWALTLGRISANSSMGQPLRAQLEVVQITAEQASSLEISLAEPERFTAANMQLNPVLKGFRATLVPSDTPGVTRIQLETTEPITEPFLDMAIQFRWAGGELLRTYTLLLDPPNLQPSPQIAPLAPDVGAPAAVAPAAVESQPTPVPTEPPEPPESAPTAPAAQAESPDPVRVTVRPGDTAARILQNHLQPGLSMDQWLLALARTNPNAFINGNVNLVKAGANLVIPTAQEAQAQSAAQAQLEIRAQTREFMDYRQRLAQTAPATPTDQPTQRIEGRVEKQVEVVTPPAPTQDRLELSAGQTAQGTPSEDIAQARQQESAQRRADELEKNLQDLQALAQAANTAEGTPSTATDATQPLVNPQEEPLAAPNALTPPVVPEPEATAADQARAAVERVVQHPAATPTALGLMVALAILGVMRARRIRQSQSFKKTAERAAAHHMASPKSVPTPSSIPLPTEDPVDPISEAEVYLAYGMDEQAEAMLRHALGQAPDSLLARLRLLDIYKTRGDVLTFNTLAQEVYEMTLGQTSEWETTASMGRALDPSNPLYHPQVVPYSQSALDLPDDVKGLSLDLDPPHDGNKRQP